MSLLTLFFVTLTINAIMGTLLSIVLIALAILIFRDLYKLNKKAQKLADQSLETAEEAKDFVEKIGKNILGYFMIKIYRASKK